MPPQPSLSPTDICTILGGIIAVITAAVIAIKYVVRSEINNLIGSIPVLIKDEVETQTKPFDKRIRENEKLVAHVYGVLSGHQLIDSGEYSTVRNRVHEDSSNIRPAPVRHKHAEAHS